MAVSAPASQANASSGACQDPGLDELPVFRSRLRGAVARRAPFVEDNLPCAVSLAAPDRVERTHRPALRIADRSRTERQSTRIEHLDLCGFPREGRRWAAEEPLPPPPYPPTATHNPLAP